MTTRLDEFRAYRDKMNARILDGIDHRGIKRFFNLDTAAYRGDGALDPKTWNYWAWLRQWCCAAMTALITTSSNALRK